MWRFSNLTTEAINTNKATRNGGKTWNLPPCNHFLILVTKYSIHHPFLLVRQVLIGCDGVNSVVSRWLGLKKPSFAGRSATRGFTNFPDGHGFSPEFVQYFGEGFRAGTLPCDEKSIYWFFTWFSSSKGKLYLTYLLIYILPDVYFHTFKCLMRLKNFFSLLCGILFVN